VPSITCHLEEWWSRERAGFSAKTSRNFDSFVMLYLVELCGKLNAWLFNNTAQQHNVQSLASLIINEFMHWSIARNGASGVFDVIERVAFSVSLVCLDTSKFR
jgi:hypothetical protein